MKQQFRILAKDFVYKNLQQRICMVARGFNRLPNADNVRLQCEILKEELSRLYSDKQLAEFIINNQNKILQFLPGKEPNANKFKELLKLANDF